MGGKRGPVPWDPAVPAYQGSGEHVVPDPLTVRMSEEAPNSLPLLTGQVLHPGSTVTISARGWRSMTAESQAATHRLLTDPKRQDQLLGGRYITTVSPEHPIPQEIR